MEIDRTLFGLLLALCALPWAGYLGYLGWRRGGLERTLDGVMRGLGYGIALASLTLVAARVVAA